MQSIFESSVRGGELAGRPLFQLAPPTWSKELALMQNENGILNPVWADYPLGSHRPAAEDRQV